MAVYSSFTFHGHGKHLTDEQIAHTRSVLPEEQHSAFDEDMCGEKKGFLMRVTTVLGAPRIDWMKWEPPVPNSTVKLLCVFPAFEEGSCTKCTGEASETT